jgi:hypothetical protein
MDVQHIHADGRLESQGELNQRLLRELGLPESDMFRTEDEVLRDAYKIHGNRIAYTQPNESDGERKKRS